MSEVDWATRALDQAAAALLETVADVEFLVMAGGALLCITLLAVMLPRSR